VFKNLCVYNNVVRIIWFGDFIKTANEIMQFFSGLIKYIFKIGALVVGVNKILLVSTGPRPASKTLSVSFVSFDAYFINSVIEYFSGSSFTFIDINCMQDQV
jgi:hypothetical protein